jgi:uncharacterized protein YqgV (UPF0045/DUF77 family)
MCSMGKIASCQISFLPVVTDNYIEDINKVLELIKSTKLECEVGTMSTTVRGDKTRILEMITKVYDNMDGKCSFVMDIKISNLCGCKD